MTSTWPLKSTEDSQRTQDPLKALTGSDHSHRNSVEWVVQEQLREVSALLTDIGTRLEVLSQVLWVRDSQELF